MPKEGTEAEVLKVVSEIAADTPQVAAQSPFWRLGVRLRKLVIEDQRKLQKMSTIIHHSGLTNQLNLIEDKLMVVCNWSTVGFIFASLKLPRNYFWKLFWFTAVASVKSMVADTYIQKERILRTCTGSYNTVSSHQLRLLFMYFFPQDERIPIIRAKVEAFKKGKQAG